jgi:ubiquinone/menaquinone biosynthesis C-methylase UbiE
MSGRDKQKDLFLGGEGDAWFERNHAAIQGRDFNFDPIVQAVARCISSESKGDTRGMSLLEIGCGEGIRLSHLASRHLLACHGIDPSAKAVAQAQKEGRAVIQGTADALPFENHAFDLVVFGFYLYLCDREDLIRIAQKADRLLKWPGWLIVQDFHAGIGVNIHYIPVHTQPFYKKMGFKEGDYPNAKNFYQEAISLPIYPTLSEDRQDKVVEIFTKELGI